MKKSPGRFVSGFKTNNRLVTRQVRRDVIGPCSLRSQDHRWQGMRRRA
ncbi:MAG: hypothetical protein KAX57_12150 [Rhodoferax sp.]|nr:hypothetical protein [Rhodoferax sp.]